jgi:hypothetical protein
MRFFFRKVINPGDCLNYLLPEPNLGEDTYQLRQRPRYAVLFARTERFRNSFILNALRNFIKVYYFISLSVILFNISFSRFYLSLLVSIFYIL